VIRWVSTSVVLAAIPIGMRQRFDPSAADGLDAVLELQVAGTDSRYAVQIADGRCTVARRAAPEAGAHVTISAGDIARLVLGVMAWPELLASGRLGLTGDPFVALRFPRLFRFAGPVAGTRSPPGR
jgi:ubiquinone biosynthesis protein UbiJ